MPFIKGITILIENAEIFSLEGRKWSLGWLKLCNKIILYLCVDEKPKWKKKTKKFNVMTVKKRESLTLMMYTWENTQKHTRILLGCVK